MKRFVKLNVFAFATLLFLGVAAPWGIGVNKAVAQNNFDPTKDRIFFEDFEKLSDDKFLSSELAPNNNESPSTNQQGKYYLYGGRGKILKDPTFGKYYQNLADANEYTKSIAQNFLRYIFTDDQRKNNANKIKSTGAITIGFWVNGQVAVDYELPLERGSMFCMFSNLRFAKADAGIIKEGEEPRFMFDISCNGWNYSYMPNSYGNPVKHYINEYAYGEKDLNSGASNPLVSLFGKANYENTLDQSKHKFYDDKKWHYITYVMDKGNNNVALSRVIMYVDGVKTGEIPNVRNKNGKGLYKSNFDGNGDYVGRTEYLRNIVLGGFTPHGMFYDRQYYSDAALAYDDIAIYSKALTQQQIQSIINQKQYNPKEWHYGDSFDEYNEGKGGNEDRYDVSGLGVNASFNESGYLIVNKNKTLTIPNVPKGYYVRIEYAYANQGASNGFPGTVGKLTWIGSRVSENNSVLPKTFEGQTYYVRTYQATELGTYRLNIGADVVIRSIIITPYEYAKLKYGNWNADRSTFSALSVSNKYVKFDVERRNGRNYYKKNGVDVGENPVLPEVSLVKDGRSANGKPVYENINNYREDLNHYPYIKYTSTAPHVAHINKKGEITMTGIAGNTTIIAELISDNQFVGSEVIDSFEIRILKEENTLRLAKNEEVTVNEKFPAVGSNKNLDNITLTIGGWYHTPNYKAPGATRAVRDSWERAVNFQGPIKPNEEILDGFNQYSIGKNVAKSESLGANGTDDGNFYPEKDFANNITPWTLPCRGAYVKFEPVKAGIVTMYLLQNGNLDDRIDTDGNSQHIYWRPVYITDETGKAVDFVQTATNGRITYHDNFFVGDKRRAQFIEDIEKTYNQTLKEDLINLKNSDYDKFHTLIDNWNNAGWRQKVIPTGDGGYMVMSKAIVRYTFNVHPGKTYYLFSNQSQIAISGFNFEEGRLLDTKTQNYETAPVRDVEEGTALNFTDVLNESQPEIPTNGKGKDITSVTYERNFAQGKWSSICLPFSMNNRQMREQFGEETAVVLLKTIHDDGKVELIWHVNQDIIAGYPYFILPKGEVKHDNVVNSTITKISVDAYFNNEIKKENPLFSVGSNGNTFDWQSTYNGSNYKVDYPYVFEGNFHNVTLPAGSYVMSNSGALTKIKNATTAKPFRAYLKYQGSNAGNAKSLYTSIDWQNDETTAINDIIFQSGILTESSDVYGIDGSIIRHDAQNLNDLSKGVYIVNGKKFVVK